MIIDEVDTLSAPVAEAWHRFAGGNAGKDDFNIILADLLDISKYGHAVSFLAFKARTGSLVDYPMHCALLAAQQEIGQHVVSLLAYTEEQIIEARRAGKARLKQAAKAY